MFLGGFVAVNVQRKPPNRLGEKDGSQKIADEKKAWSF